MHQKTRSTLLYLLVFLSGAVMMGLARPSQKNSRLSIEATPLLNYSGFTVQYDGAKKIPLYSYEKLSLNQLQKNVDIRKRYFTKDAHIYPLHQSSSQDYKESGYDQGHMAAAGNHMADEQTLQETFVLSNACPQHPSLNRGMWATLEKHIRSQVKEGTSVEVVSGPLFLAQNQGSSRRVTYSVIGSNDVAVPTHFFKLIYIDGKPTAYIFPNEKLNKESQLNDYRVSVKELEKSSGLRFQFH